jgi:hypothetical protein
VPNRNEILLANLKELEQDLRDLWRTLTRDPAKEARKERAWTVVAGVFTALGAIAARKGASKIWGILTGETPPIAKQTAKDAREATGSPRAPETASEPAPDQTPTAA